MIPRKKQDDDGNPIPQHFADPAFGGIKNKKFKDITKAVPPCPFCQIPLGSGGIYFFSNTINCF